MKIYELDSSQYILRKEKLAEVLNILKIGYNERGNGDIYRVFDHDEEALLDKYIWNLVENDNNEIIGVTIYNNGDKISRKISLMSVKAELNEENKWITTKEAKEAMNLLLEDLKPENKNKYAWAEVSGALEHILVDKMNLIPYSIDNAFNIMANKGKLVVPDKDNIHYSRKIGDEIEHKVIIGNVPKYLQKQNDNYKKIKKIIIKNIDDVESIIAIRDNLKDECIKEKITEIINEYYPDIEKNNDFNDNP